jgi:hypothetical protein
MFVMGSQILQTSLAPGLAKSSAAVPAAVVAGMPPATARDSRQDAGATLALLDHKLSKHNTRV